MEYSQNNIQSLLQGFVFNIKTSKNFSGLENRRRLIAVPGFESLAHRQINNLQAFGNNKGCLYIGNNIQLYIIGRIREADPAMGAAFFIAQYLTERTRMMQDWADYVYSLKAGGKAVGIRSTNHG